MLLQLYYKCIIAVTLLRCYSYNISVGIIAVTLLRCYSYNISVAIIAVTLLQL